MITVNPALEPAQQLLGVARAQLDLLLGDGRAESGALDALQGALAGGAQHLGVAFASGTPIIRASDRTLTNSSELVTSIHRGVALIGRLGGFQQGLSEAAGGASTISIDSSLRRLFRDWPSADATVRGRLLALRTDVFDAQAFLQDVHTAETFATSAQE